MRNVHSRLIEVPVATAGALLDQLSGPRDRLWPVPAWPALRLDDGLRAGSAGGHAFIRYTVAGHEPGRMVRFRFDPRCGLDGYHELRVEPAGQDGGAGNCRMTHVIEARTLGRMRLAWPLAVRWLHDALIEDLLDRAERAATGRSPRPRRWPAWTRCLHYIAWPRARAVRVPAGATLLTGAFGPAGLETADLADAYQMRLAPEIPADPAAWLPVTFRRPPAWVVAALRLRNAIVPLAGIERGDRSSFDPVARSGSELLVGTDAGHLDFRVSILIGDETVTVSTVARARNRRGRIYLRVIRLVHPLVVRAMLRDGHRRLALRAGTGASG